LNHGFDGVVSAMWVTPTLGVLDVAGPESLAPVVGDRDRSEPHQKYTWEHYSSPENPFAFLIRLNLPQVRFKNNTSIKTVEKYHQVTDRIRKKNSSYFHVFLYLPPLTPQNKLNKMQ
jgi:hypothetical protein